MIKKIKSMGKFKQIVLFGFIIGLCMVHDNTANTNQIRFGAIFIFELIFKKSSI